jgi:hypothetical protein
LVIAAYVQGLLLRWQSMNFSPERQPSNEPKVEDNCKKMNNEFSARTKDE